MRYLEQNWYCSSTRSDYSKFLYIINETPTWSPTYHRCLEVLIHAHWIWIRGLACLNDIYREGTTTLSHEIPQKVPAILHEFNCNNLYSLITAHLQIFHNLWVWKDVDWCKFSAASVHALISNPWSLGGFNDISNIQFWGYFLWSIASCICEIDPRQMSQDLTGDKSTLILVMAWYHQATCH